MGFHRQTALANPRKNRIIVLESLNFLWDDPELKEIADMWEQEVSICSMGEHFNRDPDEVLLAVIHLARKGRISKRKSGLGGILID